jgi:hypothetical protein
MKKSMATRVGRTIDPAKITDHKSWLSGYKSGYKNVVQDENGSLLVLDPAALAADPVAARESAKIIPHLRGQDYIDILRSEESTSELRALANSKRELIRDAIDAAVLTAQQTFMAVEQQLLEAVDAWKMADSVSSRKEAAVLVGTLSLKVQEADEAVRNTMYPHKYIKSENDLPRKALYYATQDDRVLENTLYRTVIVAEDISERIVNDATQ